MCGNQDELIIGKVSPKIDELMLTNFSLESNTDATLRLIVCSHSSTQLSIVYQVFWILVVFVIDNLLAYSTILFSAGWVWGDHGFLNALGAVDIAGSGPVSFTSSKFHTRCLIIFFLFLPHTQTIFRFI